VGSATGAPAPTVAAQAPRPPLAAHRLAADLGIPGLALLLDFVTLEEEGRLLARLDDEEEEEGGGGGGGGSRWRSLARRRVRHYGAAFDYATRGVLPAAAPPGAGGAGLSAAANKNGNDAAPPAAAAAAAAPPPPLPEWASDLARRVEAALRERGLLLDVEDEEDAREEGAAASEKGTAEEGAAEAAGAAAPHPPARCSSSSSSAETPFFNQATANEYAPGVGLAPHVDTHSAFAGPVISLSLGGPCVVEMRRYGLQKGRPEAAAPAEGGAARTGDGPPAPPPPPLPAPSPSRQGRPGALALPPRSLLVLSGEARLGWHHYIPHRKADPMLPPGSAAASGAGGGRGGGGSGGGACGGGGGGGGTGSPELVPRAARRVSLTLRRVRPADAPPCRCAWRDCCDDQGGGMPPTRAQLAAAAATEPIAPAAAAAAAAAASAAAGARAGGADDGPSASPSSSSSSEGRAAQQRDRAAALLERRHVHDVYDAISPHFDRTRFAVWPAVSRFLGALPPGAVVADVGCGNGKYFGVRRDVAVLGCDMSEGLVAAAARRVLGEPAGGGGAAGGPGGAEAAGGQGAAAAAAAAPAAAPPPLEQPPPPPLLSQLPGADALVADALALPFARGRCDAAVCVAVLHHAASSARRARLVREVARCLRVGGRALVTVWAREQADPARTLGRWLPMCAPAAAAVGAGAAGAAGAAAAPGTAAGGALSGGAAGQEEAEEEEGGRPGDGAVAAHDGGDYLVPWHMPVPKRSPAPAGAASAGAAAAVGGGETAARAGAGVVGSGAGAPAPAGLPGVPPELAAPRLDPGKRSVVYGRYYHLFGAGELEALVEAAVCGGGSGGSGGSGFGGVGGGGSGGGGGGGSSGGSPRCRVVDALFDKSNWCVTFERVE